MRLNASLLGKKAEINREQASGIFALNSVYNEIIQTWPTSKLGWAIQNATYTNKFLDVSDYETGITGIDISEDGKKLLVSGLADDGLDIFTLLNPFDVSTAEHDGFIANTVGEAYVEDCAWQTGGNAAFYVGRQRDYVTKVPLSTPYDFSSAGTQTEGERLLTLAGSSNDSNPQGLFFKYDGTKLYTSNSTNSKVCEYNLTGSPWDISTGNVSFVTAFSTATQTTTPNGIYFGDSGSKLFVISNSNKTIYEYDCSTAYSLSPSSVSYNNVSYTLASSLSGTTPTVNTGLCFSPSGKTMYVTSNGSDSIYQFTTEET